MFLQSKVPILLFEEIKHQKSTFISLNWSMILLGKWKLQFQTFHSHYLHIHTRNNLFITCWTYFVVQINLTPRYCSLWTIIFVWLLFVWTKFIWCVMIDGDESDNLLSTEECWLPSMEQYLPEQWWFWSSWCLASLWSGHHLWSQEFDILIIAWQSDNHEFLSFCKIPRKYLKN